MRARRLRLLTFNIAHGRGLNPIQGLNTPGSIRSNLLRISRLLHTVKADFVAFQEIDQGSTWAGNFDHLAYIRSRTNYTEGVFGINNERSGLVTLRYGNALLSRYPILRNETVVFGKRRLGEKGFLYVELQVGQKVLSIVNLHLHYRSRAQRFEQMETLMQWLHATEEQRTARGCLNPLVCGDFNASRSGADVTAALLSHLQDFDDYRLLPDHGEATFPSPWPSRLLDFVFVPPCCRRPQAVVVRSLLSDHRPVLLEFELVDGN